MVIHAISIHHVPESSALLHIHQSPTLANCICMNLCPPVRPSEGTAAVINKVFVSLPYIGSIAGSSRSQVGAPHHVTTSDKC
jgi:hypothetical protein